MKTKRWGIAIAGVFLQVALGAVYACSVFLTAACQAIWMEHFRSHADLYGQHFCIGGDGVLRRPLAQSLGPENCCTHGWISLWRWSFSVELLRPQIVVALSNLWR